MCRKRCPEDLATEGDFSLGAVTLHYRAGFLISAQLAGLAMKNFINGKSSRYRMIHEDERDSKGMPLKEDLHVAAEKNIYTSEGFDGVAKMLFRVSRHAKELKSWSTKARRQKSKSNL